jgi:hypothetical protein
VTCFPEFGVPAFCHSPAFHFGAPVINAFKRPVDWRVCFEAEDAKSIYGHGPQEAGGPVPRFGRAFSWDQKEAPNRGAGAPFLAMCRTMRRWNYG